MLLAGLMNDNENKASGHCRGSQQDTFTEASRLLNSE